MPKSEERVKGQASETKRVNLKEIEDRDEREIGRLAQLGERHVRNVEVGGSNPLPSTSFFFKYQ